MDTLGGGTLSFIKNKSIYILKGETMVQAKILFVEDGLDYGALFEKIFEINLGDAAILRWVTNRDSFQKTVSDGEKFDFIICDGNIPEWEGHIDEVSSTYPHIPMVFHTADANSRVELKHNLLAFSKSSEGRETLILYLRHFLNNFLGDNNGVARQHNGLLEEILATQREGLRRGDQVDRSP